MKKHICHLAFAATAALALGILPCQADAATLDLNGQIIDTATTEGNVTIVGGTTMISEDFMEDALYLSVEKHGDNVTITNAGEDFSVSGTVGEKSLTFNGQQETLSAAITEKDGKVFLPLRPLLSHFGDVQWHGDDQSITVRYDYNDQIDLPVAEMTNETFHYEIDSAQAIIPENGLMPMRMTEDGMLYEKRNEADRLVSVGTEEEDLITPQHNGYLLKDTAYAIEDDYLYWVEYPDPSLVTTASLDWYLYIQERREGAEPVIIDQAPMNDLSEIRNGEGMLAICDFKNGNAIWMRAEKATGKTEIRLYQHETGKSQTLDSTSFDQNIFSTMTREVVIGDHDAFWSNLNLLNGMRMYGDMYRVSLDTGEVTQFSKGYNLCNPTLVDEYLIVRAKPDGNNFIPDMESETTAYVSGEFWIYDLKQGQWTFKVDTSLSMLGKSAVLNGVVVLNDRYFTVQAEGLTKPYDLPVIDLENGKVYTLINDQQETLQYSPWSMVEGAVGEIRQEGTDGTCLVRIYPDYTYDGYKRVPMKIEW